MSVSRYLRALETGLSLWLALPAMASSPPKVPAVTREPVEMSSSSIARTWLHEGLQALGGEERIRALRGVRIEAIGYHHHLEQSERPEGPWVSTFRQRIELRDLQRNRLRIEQESRGVFSATWQQGAPVIFAEGAVAVQKGDSFMPGRAVQLPDLRERLALGPERVLLTALAAADTRVLPDILFQGVKHRVIAFTWDGTPIKVLLNAYSGLPTAVERVREHTGDFYWGVWGDVSTRTLFSSWTLEPGGLRYPRQWTVERNGRVEDDFTLVAVDFEPVFDDKAFDIPSDARQAFTEAVAKGPLRPAPGQQGSEELAQDVVFLPGLWNTALVRQSDGVVVLEAPISPDYSAQVMAEAKRRFPGVPIKSVISTADAFPHIGGVREYVAAGIPIHMLELNRPLLERLVAAPHSRAPDTLTRTPRKARFVPVLGKMLLGKGPNRLELYPIRGESSERMLMVYMPEHRLLYASDLIQKLQNGSFFAPQYLTELVDAVRRENLAVERVFALHAPALPWAEVEQAAAHALTPAPPAR